MFGAVIGDIIGSTFETENHRSPYFELFQKNSRFTDDTVCTVAIADILLKHYPFNIESETDKFKAQNLISNELRLWCCTYFNRGFGSLFQQWITNGMNRAYESYGNGALMRISPVALFSVKNNLSKEEALSIAKLITEITHNHPQSINAVNAYISLLYDFLNYKKENSSYIPLTQAKDLIIDTFNFYSIPLPKRIEEYRVDSEFNLTCNHSLGVACAAILETDNFDDVMYQVISAGGDSDTFAAIAGAMAEALYGVTEERKRNIENYFNSYDQDIILTLNKLYI